MRQVLMLVLAGWSAEVSVGPGGPTIVAPSDPYRVAAAAWGADALVAWTDRRFGGAPTVLLTSVLADGGLPTPSAEWASTWGAYNPRLATAGSIAALTWEQNEATYLRLLRNDGQWVTAPIYVGYGRCPDVAIGPAGGVVVFESGPVSAVRFRLDGTLVDASPVALSAASVPWAECARTAMDAASTARVIWRNGAGELFDAALGPAGAPTGPRLIDTGMGVGQLELVGLEAGHWEATAAWALSPSSVRLAGYDLGATAGLARALLPDDTWKGFDVAPCLPGLCLLARSGTTATNVQLAALPLDGGPVVPTSPMASQTNDWDLAAPANGTRLLWANLAKGEVRAQLTGTDLVPQSAQLLLNAAPVAQTNQSVAVLADTALVGWLQSDGVHQHVLVRRFDAAGVPLDAAPTAVGAPGKEYGKVALEVMGGGWVAVLRDDNERVSLVRIAVDGTVGPERVLSTSAADFAAAVDGDRLLLAMKHYVTTYWDPFLVTVEPDGGETALRLQDTPPKEYGPGVAVTGTGERLVVFSDEDPLGLSEAIIRGVRVSSTGQPLDAAGFRISPPGAPPAFEPKIVSDGDAGYLVAWRSYGLVYAQHVVGDVASAPLPIAPSPAGTASLTQHQLIKTVQGALVVYANREDGGIIAQALSVGGAGLRAGPEVAVSSTGFNAWPAASLGPQVASFTFSRADTSVNTMAGLVHSFQREGQGATCVAEWQCRSSQCEAGRCGVELAPADGGYGGGAGGGGGTGAGGGGGSDGRTLKVTCGCAAVSSPWLLLTVGLLWWGRRRTSRP